MASVFFSYSHADEALRNELESHLSMLKRDGTITTWHDRRIEPGENIDHAIDERINEDDVILLLVSPPFLDSYYCIDVELKRAMERHAEGKAVVIPIILRPCDWKSAPFGGLLALPTDGKPVTRWADRDEAFLDVAQGIRRVAARLASSTPPARASLPASPPPVPEVTPARAPAAAPPGPRSSNLRVAQSFSDRDRDRFATEAFEYIARYMQNSLEELGKRNDGVEGDFVRVDSGRFFASIYRDGKAVARCTVFYGGALGAGIHYTQGESRDSNSFNESLRIDADGQTLFLRPLGMSHFGGSREQKLSLEGGAELFWSLLIERLQSSRN